MSWKRQRRCCLSASSLPFIPAKANHGHNGTGKAMMVRAQSERALTRWMRANKMDSGLRWNNGFDLEIEKLVELSGIEPLTSTMPL